MKEACQLRLTLQTPLLHPMLQRKEKSLEKKSVSVNTWPWLCVINIKLLLFVGYQK